MSSDSLLDKLELIAATKGTKAKAAIVATYTAWERDVARWALDPTINYYIAKLDPVTANGVAEWEGCEFQLLENLASRALSGNEALDQVKFTMRELTAKSAELLRRVILKDLKCGAGVTMTNSAFPGLITDFPYMRCSLPKTSNFDTFDWSAGVYSQLKANGSFGRIGRLDGGEVVITTRQGNVYPDGTLTSLKDNASLIFNPNTETHGELMVRRGDVTLPRAEGNGMLNSLLQGGKLDEGYEVAFDCWDQIPLSAAVSKGKCATPYKERINNLLAQTGFWSGRSLISLIETRFVCSKVEAFAHYREKLAQGLEGTVVKCPKGLWRDGDSKDQVKLKLEVDVDLRIVGFRDGTAGARTEATFGSVVCQTIDGQLEVAVSGFKRDVEAYIHENRDSILGKIMCVRANEVSPPSESSELYSLFHPRFVEIRHDKVEADTLAQVKMQFENAIAA